jgi:BMFP domain-containing protein YqiC
MIEYSGKLSIEAATALAQANYNHKTQEEIITLKQRIAELEEGLAELWFTCGKFWDGDDSIEKLLPHSQRRAREMSLEQTMKWANEKIKEQAVENGKLQQRIAELEDALAYHQEQTRPIERTQKLLAKRVS